MSQLTLDQVADRAEKLQELGVRRRPRRSTLRAAKPTIDEQFFAFLESAPDFYPLVVKLSFEAKDAGFEQYSMKAIVEVVRWQYTITRGDRTFKINNNITSRLARYVEANHPALRGFFPMRELRSA
jgi:hypothetical protein